eukprot:SAG31_NODE_1703_length_7495_cov_3.115062_1_plen_387_part_00
MTAVASLLATAYCIAAGEQVAPQRPSSRAGGGFQVYWGVGTQGWKGQGTCAPLDYGRQWNVSLEQLGILPGNWTNTGEDCCCCHGCRKFNDNLPYIDPTAWEKHRQLRPGPGRTAMLPQQVDMAAHLQKVRAGVAGWIPDKSWRGNAVLDFEAWTPIWERNGRYFGPGVMNRYQNLSLQLVQKQHPSWPLAKQLDAAKSQFESAALNLLVQTLHTAKAVRPAARWGFYGYPMTCKEPWMPPSDKVHNGKWCEAANDRLAPLYREQTGSFPSIYMPKDAGHHWPNSTALWQYASGSVAEAVRQRGNGVPVLVYIWPRYLNGTTFLSDEDLKTSLMAPWQGCADGIVIWGSGKDANSSAFWRYTREKIGPALVAMRSQPRNCSESSLA